ncbi:MAG: hypothetical protein KC657_09045 [Myxococcales bacterium]|nr:hypothetical protein [Myxococcales bacterium]
MTRPTRARAEGLRDAALVRAFTDAVAGKTEGLYASLAFSSRLPGPRPNLDLAEAVALECVAKGASAERLVTAMTTLGAVEAPGGSPYEFIPMVGVIAVGALGASLAKFRPRAVALLHDAATDLRYRVRGVVPSALARIGEVEGDALVASTADWTDGYFHAAALVLALAEERWLAALDDRDEVLARLDEAFSLAETAPRAAERYPGRKALVEALAEVPVALTVRFGQPVLELLARHSKTKMPELREAIEKTLASKKISGRHVDGVAMVRAALAASETAPRDPTRLIKGMRGRGKKAKAR